MQSWWDWLQDMVRRNGLLLRVRCQQGVVSNAENDGIIIWIPQVSIGATSAARIRKVANLCASNDFQSTRENGRRKRTNSFTSSTLNWDLVGQKWPNFCQVVRIMLSKTTGMRECKFDTKSRSESATDIIHSSSTSFPCSLMLLDQIPGATETIKGREYYESRERF